MKDIKKPRFSNKSWILLFSGLIIVCLLFIFLIKNNTNSVAVIYQDGKEIARIDLALVTKSYTIPLEGNCILVEPGAIRMQSADCPDQICVHPGVMHDTGRIVCLPNRVMIEMEHAGNTPDAKAG